MFATSQSIATQWPLISMATVGVAYGPVVAGLLGLLIGPAELGGRGHERLRRVGHCPRSCRSWRPACSTERAAPCSGGRPDAAQAGRRRDRRPASTRRGRPRAPRHRAADAWRWSSVAPSTTDPELAAAAREADRDLRSFLFGSAGRVVGDLETRVRSEVERVRRGHDTPVTRQRDRRRMPARRRRQERFARAIGEAVAERPRARECQPSRRLRRDRRRRPSVRERQRRRQRIRPGSRPLDSHGLDESIIGRIEAIGGRVEITSTPEDGTEVCLWSSAT